MAGTNPAELNTATAPPVAHSPMSAEDRDVSISARAAESCLKNANNVVKLRWRRRQSKMWFANFIEVLEQMM